MFLDSVVESENEAAVKLQDIEKWKVGGFILREMCM